MFCYLTWPWYNFSNMTNKIAWYNCLLIDTTGLKFHGQNNGRHIKIWTLTILQMLHNYYLLFVFLKGKRGSKRLPLVCLLGKREVCKRPGAYKTRHTINKRCCTYYQSQNKYMLVTPPRVPSHLLCALHHLIVISCRHLTSPTIKHPSHWTYMKAVR